MLTELHVKNFLLIEEARLQFEKGLNVLSGETGHGKSILLDAFALLLGEKASPQMLRSGATEAFVEAVFDLSHRKGLVRRLGSLLSESGVDVCFEDGAFLIKRVIRADGRSQAYLNGSPVLVKTLREVGDLLVDVHGQHEHQSLLHRSVYLDLLDAFAGAEELAERVREHHAIRTRLLQSLLEKNQLHARRQERIAEIQRQLEEIDTAELNPEEEEQLKTERRKLQHAEQLRSGAQKIHLLLYEGSEDSHSSRDLLCEAQRTLSDMVRVEESLQSVQTELETVLVTLEEIARQMIEYSDGIEFSQDAQERVDQRLFALQNLKSKYGSAVQAILDYAEQIRTELDQLRKEQSDSENLEEDLRKLEAQLIEECTALSQMRTKAATALQQKVLKEFADLGLGEARVEIVLSQEESPDGLAFPEGKKYQISARGLERAEILMAANPGQALASLKEAASGGEISRIMLALKAVFAQADQVPTLVFDEIDIGIGGRAAQTVASKLRKVSESHQVICITHLAAIASQADCNFAVQKEQREGNTFTTVERLEGEERMKEITRMLTGSDTAASRETAKELLSKLGKGGG